MDRIKRFIQSKNKTYKLISFLIKRELVLYTKLKNRYSPIKYGLYEKDDRHEKIIVSLTSYPARFSTIIPALKSLLLQTVKPDKIIVWIGCSQNNLTDDMINMEQYGVEFRCNIKDLRAHTKYIWALQEFSNDIVITVDDDNIYPSTLISSLLKAHKKFPKCVCARRVHKITMFAGSIMPYNEWEFDYTDKDMPSDYLFATGVGGVLYPPHIFGLETFDEKNIKELSYLNDDIWLKFMEILSWGGVKVVWAKNYLPHPIEIANTQETALRFLNVIQNQNDECIKKILNVYGEKIYAHLKGEVE